MSYYVDGYMPPEFIKNADDVKFYQRALGVNVDGIWGKKTQAAYDSWMNGRSKSDANAESSVQSQTSGVKGGGYNWPSELPKSASDWENVSKLLKEYLESIMRPKADAAISAREGAAKTNMAETDADAAARGMLGSTFVSSLKSREMASAQSDIRAIETDYMAAVSEQLYKAMSDLQKQVLEEKREQYQADLDREKLNLEREKLDFEREKLDRQYEYAYGNSGSRNKGGSGSKGTEGDNDGNYIYTDEFGMIEVPDTSYDECRNMLRLLGDEAYDFFKSEDTYWRRVRVEVQAALTKEEYDKLRAEFIREVDDPSRTPSAPGTRSKTTNGGMIV